MFYICREKETKVSETETKTEAKILRYFETAQDALDELMNLAARKGLKPSLYVPESAAGLGFCTWMIRVEAGSWVYSVCGYDDFLEC